MYGAKLTNRLNNTVMSLFHHIYRGKNKITPIRFLTRTFPGAMKHNLHFFAIALALFWGPFLLLALSGNWGMEWIQSLLGPNGMYQLDASYGKSGDALKYGRETHGSNFYMFCHYVSNNVGIGLRTFTGGIAFGIGTLFFTLFNGLMIGASFGYVHEVGDPHKLYNFVAGHAAFELLGLNLTSAAGLRLAWGLIAPGNQSRAMSLLRSARHSLVILGGGAILIFLAAIIEGFWSAYPYRSSIKYSVGAFFWIITLAYLFSGRKEWYKRP